MASLGAAAFAALLAPINMVVKPSLHQAYWVELLGQIPSLVLPGMGVASSAPRHIPVRQRAFFSLHFSLGLCSHLHSKEAMLAQLAKD
ncbi:unnamed protein product [Protopolystoma xenopodis]|uniref:Uncharacterized protein n=1 Tax=Protopolystoma xenopodis TaxID=117903 RepID=A0A3S5B8Q3_9PLAT|nr:unnamed protein product [Protopolystoma xenopodis]